MSGDPERDDSKPRPTAPAGVLGGSGKRPESASVETGKRVPKSAFAQTIAGLNVPGAAPAPSEPEKLDVQRSTSDAAEPLREPSERPAPTPYKRERANGAWSGTLQMPELGKALGNRSEERMIAAKPGVRVESAPVAVHGAAIVGTPDRASREPTVRMSSAVDGGTPTARPPSNRPLPAAPPPSGAPPAMPSAQSPAAKSPIPPGPMPSARAAAPKRDDHSVPRLSLGVEKIPSGPPASKLDVSGMSQPLQLSLDARDHVESSLRPEASVPTRSMLPWIILGVLLIGGVVAFALTRGGDEPPPVTADRVEAVPAATPAVPTPAAEAVAPSVPGAVPAAPVIPSAPPANTKPTPARAVAEAKAAPVEDKPAAKPATKRKTTRRTKKAAAKADGPVLKVSPQGEDDLEEALRAAERMAEPEEDLAPPEPPSAEPPAPDEE
jgi:hypothetical protein